MSTKEFIELSMEEIAKVANVDKSQVEIVFTGDTDVSRNGLFGIKGRSDGVRPMYMTVLNNATTLLYIESVEFKPVKTLQKITEWRELK